MIYLSLKLPGFVLEKTLVPDSKLLIAEIMLFCVNITKLWKEISGFHSDCSVPQKTKLVRIFFQEIEYIIQSLTVSLI